MRLSSLMLLLTASFLAAGCGSTPADKDILQGAWYLTAEETDGKPTSPAQMNAMDAKIIFQAEKYALKNRGNTIEQGTFSVDPSKTPKTVTFLPKSGLWDGTPKEGIYAFEEDALKVCYAAELNKERPTGFTTQLNSGHLMQKYKRVPK